MTKYFIFFYPLLLLACTLTDNLSPSQNKSIPRRAALDALDVEAILQPTDAPRSTACTITAIEALHLRTAPAITAEVLDYLFPGEVVTRTLSAPVDEWIEVRTSKNKTGWINSNYSDCEVTK